MIQPLINISRKQAWLYSIFLVLYEFLTYIANDMIMPGMIQVVSEFHAPESYISMSFTAYILGGASLQLFLGPLSDCYGRRPVMLWGAFFFFVCTVLIVFSQSIAQFMLIRFFQGMGLCFISVIGYATLQEIFAEMDAVRLIAIMTNVSVMAPLIGPLSGAIVMHHFSWRYIFSVIAVFSLLAVWGLRKWMPEPIGQVRRDGVEIKKSTLSYRTVIQNYKQLLLNKAFLKGAIALALLSLPCVIWIALSPILLVLDAQLSVLEYGVWQLPVFGAYILGNVSLQFMTHKRALDWLVRVGSVIALLGMLLSFLLPMLGNDHFYWLMPGLLIYFFGYGFAGAPLNRLILFLTTLSKGTVSAFVSVLIMVVLALGIEMASVFDIGHDSRAFGLFCALTGLIYGLFLKKERANRN